MQIIPGRLWAESVEQAVNMVYDKYPDAQRVSVKAVQSRGSLVWWEYFVVK
jgi:hypothetical protein